MEREDPATILDIAYLRFYARTKHTLDTAKDEDIKHTSMVDKVFDIQKAIMKDRKAKRES